MKSKLLNIASNYSLVFPKAMKPRSVSKTKHYDFKIPPPPRRGEPLPPPAIAADVDPSEASSSETSSDDDDDDDESDLPNVDSDEEPKLPDLVVL